MSKKPKPVILIGTSGWSYKSWRGPFFPPKLPARLHLDYYAHHFATTELNGVFYRTPTAKAVRAWAAQTPPKFVFAWKASKFITHWKRLGPESENSLALLESRLRLLKTKAGPVLFQLPPQFQKNSARLASFLQQLGKSHPYVFEFRHSSWYTQEVFDLLRDNGCALCISDHHDAPAPWEVTAPHVYVRAHGPSGNYRDRYAPQTLTAWARRLSRLQKEGHSIYVYFDNDQKSAAPLDAARLVRLMHLDQ
ncbi:hypothetical protein NB311A_15247 [Nitrobacter sp. Nb-311A]|uniref:DUF72 domain-containing protein n=1 Tax=unclassified Nitrobacter TaxID=2620411 RepID=UPI0000686021|nr:MULTISPECIES: DUF72 domain-containing protein [unclassified Nitrobacter]EAQ36635.1 hypothetical protein NB311A_15247 [Nitrobacter sp. Nb-311A]MCB1393166.1 DUF72 domain-containing protein [Nitrobacter sp.]MCV0386010.1 DUF72 domain-containing protein [Nitrobacter sp.]